MKKTVEFLTHEQIQNQEFKILIDFREFCQENDLKFSLIGGTLLGAIRHKGFIPWDDDIDVCMPRRDYEKFLELFSGFNSRTGYRIARYPDNNLKESLFIKIINPKIAVRDIADRSSSNSFLWIDVFPYDGLPEGETEAEQVMEKARVLRNVVWLSQTKWTFGDSLLKKISKCLIGPIVLLFGLNKLCLKQLCKLAKQFPYEDSNKVACIVWGLYGSGEIVERDKFSIYQKKEFCGEYFPIISCWHEYLSGIYGDYMTLPPESERKNHGLKAWFV